MPLTPNGKVDRLALAALDAGSDLVTMTLFRRAARSKK